MNKTSRSKLQANVLETLRTCEATGQSVFVTVDGRPTVELRRYSRQERNPKQILKGSVLAFLNPAAPIDER